LRVGKVAASLPDESMLKAFSVDHPCQTSSNPKISFQSSKKHVVQKEHGFVFGGLLDR
jgi:hypothetical protein